MSKFSRIISKCRLDFQPAKLKLEIPEQLEMFGSSNQNKAHIKMGLFYEMLTACLIGGKLTDGLFRINRPQDLPYPDVMTNDGKIIIESKACRLGHQLNLLDGQIGLYRRMQINNSKARIMYAIWRHRFQKIKAYKGTTSMLFSELSQKTAHGVILPLSIILFLHDMKKEKRQALRDKHNLILRRYESNSWDYCTRTGSPIWNEFLLNPENTIRNIGMDPDDFTWVRFIVPPIQLNASTIQGVPFIIIADKTHKKAVKKSLDIIPF